MMTRAQATEPNTSCPTPRNVIICALDKAGHRLLRPGDRGQRIDVATQHQGRDSALHGFGESGIDRAHTPDGARRFISRVGRTIREVEAVLLHHPGQRSIVEGREILAALDREVQPQRHAFDDLARDRLEHPRHLLVVEREPPVDHLRQLGDEARHRIGGTGETCMVVEDGDDVGPRDVLADDVLQFRVAELQPDRAVLQMIGNSAKRAG